MLGQWGKAAVKQAIGEDLFLAPMGKAAASADRQGLDTYLATEEPKRSGMPRPVLLRRPLAASLERRRLQLYIALMLFDIVALFGCLVTVGWAYQGDATAMSGLLCAQLFAPLYLTVAVYNRAYSIQSLRSLKFAITQSIEAIVLASALLFFVLFLVKVDQNFSRMTFAGGLACSAAVMILGRRALRSLILSAWGPNPTNVLVIRDDGPDLPVRDAFRVDVREHGLVPSIDDPAALHAIGMYFRNMDRVIVSCTEERRAIWAAILRASGVQGEVHSEALHHFGAIALQRNEGFTSLVISYGPMSLRARLIKRVMDLGFALAGLVVLAPVFALVALAIKLEDGGPVLFRQRRLGRGNCYFDILKFRSMTVAGTDHEGHQSASREDQRITRVGRFIRRTSLDEFPQLLNVVKGEMSLVGPRPHALGSRVDDQLFWEIESNYWSRHRLKPGLTGLAQIKGLRGATEVVEDLTERVRYDLEYIRTWSPVRDLWIMFMTIRVLWHDRAY